MNAKKAPAILSLVEVSRGSIAIVIAVFFLLDREQSIHILLFILGCYLLIDGVLDILKIIAERRKVHHKRIEYLVTIGSMLLGVTSLLWPNITIFLFLVLVSLRFLVRGVEIIREAIREKSKHVGVSWLYGLLLIIVSPVPLIIPVDTFFFLLFFLSIYAFCDGFYLILRGLLLRFVPRLFAATYLQASESLLDLSADLPSSTRRALVFVRRTGANGLGHIAWTFEWDNGWFNAGSVEDNSEKPFAQPSEMDFWSTHTLDPIATIQKQKHPYDEYKLFHVKAPHPKQAWKTVIWESRIPYVLVRHNCNDIAYDVLRAYGVVELYDPFEEYVPNDWYDSLPGHSFPIADHPVIPLHLRQKSLRPLTVQEIPLMIPERIEGVAPDWRVNGRHAWAEFVLIREKMFNDIRRLFVLVTKRIRRGSAT